VIIGICGLSGSGKSAAGEVLVMSHNYVAIAFADVMKRICMEVFDFTEEQVWGDGKNVEDERYPRGISVATKPPDELGIRDARFEGYLTPRLALQKLGSWGRECYPDTWAERALKDAETVLDKCIDYNRMVGPVHAFSRDYDGVIITDVRFKNEIAAVKKAGGKLVRIVRPGHQKPKWDHPSETEQLEVPDEEFDYIVDNGGDLHLLELEVGRMLSYLKGQIHPYDDSQKDVPPFKRDP